MTPQILAIVGPTASGKTEVAWEVSKLLPVEMISCDSMQIYKGMSLISQAPPKTKKGLRTHLVSLLNPSEEYNAALFRKDALSLITQILKKKKIPLLVGGTGLYLKALLDGLFEPEEGRPSSDEALRKRLLAEQKTHEGNYLHEKLAELDPASAHKIHPNDARRLVRALEVFYLTEKPLSEQKANRRGLRGDFECRIFLLDRDRNELYERINRRVDQMIKEGLAEEVKQLSRGRLSVTAQMALGIREMNQYFSGQCTIEDAVELLKRHTRNYAKRQLSWFRHEKGVKMVPVLSHETARQTAAKIIRSWKAPHA